MGTTSLHRGRILVIDDDRLVTTALERSLSGSYDVVVEQRGFEVLERIRRGERFDVILCDVMMPQMTGIELYEVLGTVAPDQASAMVFVTGGASSAKARAFLDALRNPRINKPFTLPALIAVIDKCLAERE
jgi:CheY-like chemotaxis protein